MYGCNFKPKSFSFNLNFENMKNSCLPVNPILEISTNKINL